MKAESPHSQSRGSADAQKDLKSLLWPIARRFPRYMHLAYALARDPAIPQRHKMLLYATVIYQVTPVHLVVTPIPVIGQIDTLVLLILSIRRILDHCPEEVARRHFARLRLPRHQLDLDAETVQKIGATRRRQPGRRRRARCGSSGGSAQGLGDARFSV